MALAPGQKAQPRVAGSTAAPRENGDDSDSGSDIDLEEALHSNYHSSLNNSTQFAALIKFLPRYQLTFPESVVRHYLAKAGCKSDDPVVVRLVAVAAQKFAHGILEGALSHERRADADDAEGSGLSFTEEGLNRSLQDLMH